LQCSLLLKARGPHPKAEKLGLAKRKNRLIRVLSHKGRRSRLGEDRAILLAAALGVKPEFILFPNGFERPDLQQKLSRIKKKLEKMEKAS
jgi:hypothetical protein